MSSLCWTRVDMGVKPEGREFLHNELARMRAMSSVVA